MYLLLLENYNNNNFIRISLSSNFLASEAIKAFDQFLPALDRFFDLYEELTEKNEEWRYIC